MPRDHKPRGIPHAYLQGAKLRGDLKGPLLRTIGRRTGRLKRTVPMQANAYAIIGGRAAVGVATQLGNHSFPSDRDHHLFHRTAARSKKGPRRMAAHESAHTTKLYNRRHGQVMLDQVERIVI